MSNIKAVWNRWIKKIKSTDRIILSCIATGFIFLLFALIQIIIIAAGNIHIAFDNVLLIITDFAVTAAAGFAAFRRNETVQKQKRPAKKRRPSAKKN